MCCQEKFVKKFWFYCRSKICQFSENFQSMTCTDFQVAITLDKLQYVASFLCFLFHKIKWKKQIYDFVHLCRAGSKFVTETEYWESDSNCIFGKGVIHLVHMHSSDPPPPPPFFFKGEEINFNYLPWSGGDSEKF